jgi:hypothetical protein
MSDTDVTAQVVDRLIAANWGKGLDLGHTNSRVDLMREYLRRSACWAHELDCTEMWPYFDIAAQLDPAVRADPALVSRLEDYFADHPVGPTVVDTAIWALHWTTLKSAKGRDLPDLDDPFEPLITMYERGGGFVTHHGEIQVDIASFRRGKLGEHLSAAPVVSLDTAVLDQRDMTLS